MAALIWASGLLFFFLPQPERISTLRKGFFPFIGKCAQDWRYFGAERRRLLQAVFEKQATGKNRKCQCVLERAQLGGGGGGLLHQRLSSSTLDVNSPEIRTFIPLLPSL